MKFEIRNRWTGDVQFTAEIECDENASYELKLGGDDPHWLRNAKVEARAAVSPTAEQTEDAQP
jgi:hypothetical protein